MENKPKVSVLVDTYNHEKYIRNTLESIINQVTDFAIEILVADDASTDATQAIIEKYVEKYPDKIKAILGKENKKATRNIYSLIIQAKGEYIVNLDGDDALYGKDRLKRQADFLDKNPKYIGVAGKCHLIDEVGNSIDENIFPERRKFWKYEKEEYTLSEWCEWRMPGQYSCMMYRNIYKRFPDDYTILYKSHSMVADRTIAMLVAVHGTVKILDDDVLGYRYVEKKEGTNWMSKDVLGGDTRFGDYQQVVKLERYVKAHYGKEINMNAYKKDRIAAAAIIFLNSRSKYDFGILIKFVMYDGKPLRNMWVACSAMIQKCFFKLMGTPERNVKV